MRIFATAIVFVLALCVSSVAAARIVCISRVQSVEAYGGSNRKEARVVELWQVDGRAKFVTITTSIYGAWHDEASTVTAVALPPDTVHVHQPLDNKLQQILQSIVTQLKILVKQKLHSPSTEDAK